MYNYGYNYRYGYSDMDPAMAVVVLLVSLAISILTLIAWCKMFSKAGLPWERIFVPGYGAYWQYKIADCSGLFWAFLAMPFAMGLLTALGEIGGFLALILAIAMLVMIIVYLVHLAKAFGKSGWFAIGLLLLNPIFIMILGFGSAEYQGSATGYTGVQVVSEWTCPVCGAANPASRGTCSVCGSRR